MKDKTIKRNLFFTGKYNSDMLLIMLLFLSLDSNP